MKYKVLSYNKQLGRREFKILTAENEADAKEAVQSATVDVLSVSVLSVEARRLAIEAEAHRPRWTPIGALRAKHERLFIRQQAS